MSRPLRLEFSGALYHVTSRGNARKAIYLEVVVKLIWSLLYGLLRGENEIASPTYFQIRERGLDR